MGGHVSILGRIRALLYVFQNIREEVCVFKAILIGITVEKSMPVYLTYTQVNGLAQHN